jgi:thioredoxin-like negative regulator of GroEL
MNVRFEEGVRACPLPAIYHSLPASRYALLAVLLLALPTGKASSQEVAWRYDYNQARREAQEKALPLVLDFSTENCFWCRKLEETTFRDPAVFRTMNERFIPLKVDAYKNAPLTEALRIQSFPTIVLAAPDGKIIGTLEGYMEAPRFQQHLERALTAVANPEWMTRDFQEASRAVSSSDYARAVALLKSITEDDKGLPVQVKSRQLLSDLELQAAGRLARARQLEDRGQTTEALDALTELLRLYGGTQAAGEGGQLLTALTAKPEIRAQQRAQRARELLAQAREDYRTQQYLWCLDRCEVLVSSYSDLPEGALALQLGTEIRNNPEWMQQACGALSERLSLMYLSLAECQIKNGQLQQATASLERVIQAFPGSRHAEAAQLRLAQLQGRPAGRENFKK